MINILSVLTIILSIFFGDCYAKNEFYNTSNEPIDVIIPCTAKDLDTLEMCIEGIKNNCSQIRRVIIISAKKLTDSAEWFGEENFPFNKYDVALEMFQGDERGAENYISKSGSRVGWYYQQLLKFYAPFIIPGISSNVLILDSDTIFLNPVEFFNSSGKGLYNPGTEYHPPYFMHMNKLTKGKIKKLSQKYSGISHHMLFQKSVLAKLFKLVESIHNKDFWKAFCSCVDKKRFEDSGASEYEIYFNFVLKNTNQAEIRLLQWTNLDNMQDIPIYKKKGYHYVSCHEHMRR